MSKPYWKLPTADELDAFLSLTLVQRGEQLEAMSPSRRVAYAVAYSKRDHRQPYRVLDSFAAWQQLYLNSLQVSR